MKHLKTFFSRFVRSISDVTFYKKVWDIPFWHGVLFFTGWMLLIGLITSSYFAFELLPPIKAEVQTTVHNLPAEYPDDLQIFISNNTLSMSRETIHIPLPENWLQPNTIDPASTPELLAVLTRTEVTPEEWQAEHDQTSLFFVNHTTLYINSLSDTTAMRWTAFPLGQITGDQTLLINASNISERANTLNTLIITYFPYVQTATILALVLVHYLSRLLVALFESIFIFLLLKIYGKRISLLPVFIFGFHVMVPAEIINQVALFAWPNSPVSFLTLSFWILSIFILYSIRQSLPANNNKN